MDMIELTWLGHSCFRAECAMNIVVIDPFAPGSVPGLRDINEQAHRVLCSHEHHDHNYREGVRCTLWESEMAIRSYPSFHDDCQGAERGPNKIFILDDCSVRVAHMGDIGCMPSPEVLEALRGVDAMLIPVGGHYTVGPREAMEIVRAAEPRVVIPMHYRSPDFGFDVLRPVEDFLALCGNWRRAEGNRIEICKDTQPGTVVLQYRWYA